MKYSSYLCRRDITGTMIDITRNAFWTEDCCGKMDLDFSVLECDTRYWTDNTCKCNFRLCPGVYNYHAHELHEPFEPIKILSSDYIKGATKEECQMKARQWYNEHAVHALELAILELTNKED